MTGFLVVLLLPLQGLAQQALDACGGPVIGRDARVLRPDGSPIPGLFGAGNCIASPAGQRYRGAGEKRRGLRVDGAKKRPIP